MLLGLAVAAGALLHAGLPLSVVAAQKAVPESAPAAAGVVMGLSSGLAGFLYIGVGAVQDVIGVTAAITLTTALLVPAAMLVSRGFPAADA